MAARRMIVEIQPSLLSYMRMLATEINTEWASEAATHVATYVNVAWAMRETTRMGGYDTSHHFIPDTSQFI